MTPSGLPKDAIEEARRDREIRLLIGCERCGRRICHIDENGQTLSVSSMAIIPDESADESCRMMVCEACHGRWLLDRIYGQDDE